VRTSTTRRLPWFGALVTLGLAATAFMALVGAPADAEQGDAQRLMYLHVPAAWLAYLAFTVTAIASALWLLPRTRSMTWDVLAGASAEVGVLFTALTLAVGSIWGKPIWGSWWEWDARLTTTAVLFFLYLGYLALRRAGGSPDQRAKRSAIAALVAFVDVPIVHFSVNWFQTLHQDGTVFNRKMQVEISGTMAATLVVAVVAFTLLYAYLCARRMELLQLEEGFEERELARAIAERIAQDTPSPSSASSEPSPEPMVGV
jgi:heme exporter protein C